MDDITIEVAVFNNENANLGIKPLIGYFPCTFDVNFLMYYILYEENIGFAIGSIPFSCKKTEENINKFKEAFKAKVLTKGKENL